MEIEKIKITQSMRKVATREAIQHKFKKRVEEYHKKLKDITTNYVVNSKENKLAIEAYKNLSEDFKNLVRVENVITFKVNEEPKNVHKNLMLTITSNMDYLKEDSENHFPFCKRGETSEYSQSVVLPFSYPLIKNFFVFSVNKIPAKLQNHLNVREELIKEIDEFAKNTYHALCHVKSVKEIRENVPALEQFIPVPEKQFTQLVPYSFFQKVNKSINA
jgi:hypothetical protein